MKKILIMGLPGSGKTTLAKRLSKRIEAVHWNADDIRININKDLGFSLDDRIEQARRMGWLCDKVVESGHRVIADFVCPTEATRKSFGDAIIIWMNTIKESRYQDTNNLFEEPQNADFVINSFDELEKYFDYIVNYILDVFDRWNDKNETVQMLGRFQPWHQGHRELFELALSKTGQVCIMVRDTGQTDEKNPFTSEQVVENIHKSLKDEFEGHYKVMVVPNIVNITYGRDVGYKIEQERLSEDIEKISATEIRKFMMEKNDE